MRKSFVLIFIAIVAIYAVACNNETADTSVSDGLETSVTSQEDASVSYAESVDDESLVESNESVVSEDVSEDASEESSETVSEDSNISEDVSKDVSEDASEDASEEEPVTEPKEDSIVKPESEPEVSENVTEDVSEEENTKEPHVPTELEAEALRLINVNRANHGLAPLEFNTEIYDCARIRTEEIIVHWGHIRPNGENFRTVYEENGFDWKKYWTGENLAGRFKDMEQVIGMLMDSEGHRKNLLCPEYTSVSLAVIETEKGYYMAQLFLG